MHALAFASLLLGPLAAFSDPMWVTGTAGSAEIPINAVWAGAENGDQNYVCRSAYENGLHPGKLLAGHCNIEFAGKEVVRDDFEVLTADSADVSWVEDSLGYAPALAFPAGEENGSALFACRAQVTNLDGIDRGVHAGKVVGGGCNIAYGGTGYIASTYAVLEIKMEEPVGLRAARNGRAAGGVGESVAESIGKGPHSGPQAYGVDGRALTRVPAAVVKLRP